MKYYILGRRGFVLGQGWGELMKREREGMREEAEGYLEREGGDKEQADKSYYCSAPHRSNSCC